MSRAADARRAAEIRAEAIRFALGRGAAPLPLTVRSMSRAERARITGIGLGAMAMAYVLLATAICWLVANDADRAVSSGFGFILGVLIALGILIAGVMALAWRRRVRRYTDPGHIVTLDRLAITLRRPIGYGLRVPWQEVELDHVAYGRFEQWFHVTGVTLRLREVPVEVSADLMRNGNLAAVAALQCMVAAGRLRAPP